MHIHLQLGNIKFQIIFQDKSNLFIHILKF